MLAFIDESGDVGFKFAKGSTPYFTVAVIALEGPDEVSATTAAIAGVRSALGFPPSSEFHFSKMRHDTRLAFLSAVADCPFHAFTFSLDKRRLRGDFSEPGKLYRLAVQRTCEDAFMFASSLFSSKSPIGVHVVVDRNGPTAFRRLLATYVRSIAKQQGSVRVRKLTYSDSASDSLVQLADVIAGVTQRRLVEKDGAYLYVQRIRKRLVHQSVWPNGG